MGMSTINGHFPVRKVLVITRGYMVYQFFSRQPGFIAFFEALKAHPATQRPSEPGILLRGSKTISTFFSSRRLGRSPFAATIFWWTSAKKRILYDFIVYNKMQQVNVAIEQVKHDVFIRFYCGIIFGLL
jgi:hypothetical protein